MAKKKSAGKTARPKGRAIKAKATPSRKTILVVGTYDTKSDELRYLTSCITKLGGRALTMDVSVLGDPPRPTRFSKHDVAKAAGSSIQAAIDAGDENHAMQIMAKGASAITRQLHDKGRIDGLIALGGTMGTDLALDCAKALPLGVPKYIVSTVAFSPLIPPERLSADIQMILWAGGLYGLNSLCKASLSQAAGAVLGAAGAVAAPHKRRPLIGMTSFGSTVLRYMKYLKPELEKRGFEVAVFHATGMGGMAFESIVAEGGFAAVMDFAPQELGNYLMGSMIHGGADRLTNAGKVGIPQIVAPGCLDLVDFAATQPVPARLAGKPVHAHNRLLKSAVLNGNERREVIREVGNRLAAATGPVRFIMPLKGIHEWDKEGGPAHDPVALADMIDEARRSIAPRVEMIELNAHINDRAFAETVLKIFDLWLSLGTIKRGTAS